MVVELTTNSELVIHHPFFEIKSIYRCRFQAKVGTTQPIFGWQYIIIVMACTWHLSQCSIFRTIFNLSLSSFWVQHEWNIQLQHFKSKQGHCRALIFAVCNVNLKSCWGKADQWSPFWRDWSPAPSVGMLLFSLNRQNPFNLKSISIGENCWPLHVYSKPEQ